MTDGRGTGGDSEWQDQCRRWTGNWNGMCGWQGGSLEGSRRPGPGWRGEGGGGSRGQRVVRGRDDGLEPKREGGRTWGMSVVTGLGRKPVGGCYSAEMRRAPRMILSYAETCDQEHRTRSYPLGVLRVLDRGYEQEVIFVGIMDSLGRAKWQNTIWLLNLNDDTMCPHVWRWGKCTECVWLRGW